MAEPRNRDDYFLGLIEVLNQPSVTTYGTYTWGGTPDKPTITFEPVREEMPESYDFDATVPMGG